MPCATTWNVDRIAVDKVYEIDIMATPLRQGATSKTQEADCGSCLVSTESDLVFSRHIPKLRILLTAPSTKILMILEKVLSLFLPIPPTDRQHFSPVLLRLLASDARLCPFRITPAYTHPTQPAASSNFLSYLFFLVQVPDMLVTAVLVCGLAATGRAAGQANVSVDWPTFLARADPIWTQVPQAWHEAGFVGNGRLGGLVRAAADGVSLQLDVGSSAVWDDRQPGGPHSYTPDNNNCNRPRLPLGALVLDGFSMDPTSFQMRLGLWDAEVTGTAADIDAADGAIAWRVFAHAVYSAADVLVATVTHTSTTAVDVPTWRFNPAVAAMPWAQRACHGLVPNPPVANTTSNVDGVQVFTQAHLSGTEHATAILTVTNQSTHNGVVTTTTVLYVSTSAVLPHGVGASTALDAVRTAAGLGVEALTAAHRVWWHEYYPSGGFITLANPKIESFYWCQMYAGAPTSPFPLVACLTAMSCSILLASFLNLRSNPKTPPRRGSVAPCSRKRWPLGAFGADGRGLIRGLWGFSLHISTSPQVQSGLSHASGSRALRSDGAVGGPAHLVARRPLGSQPPAHILGLLHKQQGRARTVADLEARRSRQHVCSERSTRVAA